MNCIRYILRSERFEKKKCKVNQLDEGNKKDQQNSGSNIQGQVKQQEQNQMTNI